MIFLTTVKMPMRNREIDLKEKGGAASDTMERMARAEVRGIVLSFLFLLPKKAHCGITLF